MTLEAFTSRWERFHRPEYTGANRCLPCTAVNLVLASILTGTVAVVSRPAAVAVAVVALVSIYGRGYFVPGTPELTKQYLPERVLRWFGKAPAPLTTSSVDPGDLLETAGVLQDTADGGDLELDPDFAAVWLTRTRKLLSGPDDGERAALAAMLDVPHEALVVTSFEDGLTAYLDDEWLGTWESRAAFFADIAALDLLGSYVPEWSRLTTAARSETAGGLRLFSEVCPVCDGAVELGEETVSSCCSTRRVVAVACVDCGTRLLELRVGTEVLDGTDDPLAR
jgi:hypothetical protein